MWKLVKVINNKDRYFNWARKGWIIEVSEDRVNYYLQHGFSLLKEVEAKNNIVTTNPTTVGNWPTVAELKKELDHLGVDHSACKRKADYEKLLEEAKTKTTTSATGGKWLDVEALKTQLVSDAILTAEELEGKTDEEVKQIATDNWLI